MGAVSLSKGSRSRVRNRQKYRDNFDAIKWESQPKTCLNCGRNGDKCAYPQHTGIKACEKWVRSG